MQRLAGDGSRKGQGFLQNKHRRKATEMRAMDPATDHYEGLGWTVTDVSTTPSHDLVATKDGAEKHIEVKGTKSLGQEVLLTPNEVAHARTYDDVALYVAHSIELEGNDENTSASGGVPLIYDPWIIDDGGLEPIGYAYTTPG